MAQEKFRVGITRDNLKPDGKPIFDEACLKALDDPRIQWEFLPELEPELTPQTAAKYDAVCVMVGRITRATVSGSDRRLKLIARFGVGYDMMDVPALTENGVLLAITPDGIRRPVATRGAHLRADARTEDPDQGPAGARRALERAGQPHGHRAVRPHTWLRSVWATSARSCSAWPRRSRCATSRCDPYVTQESVRPLGVTLVDMETLFREADFLCVNCPLNEETRKLVGARQFA